MVIAPRYDGWFDKLIEIPAIEIPAHRPGKYCAGQIVTYRRDQAIVVVDMGGGYGNALYEALHDIPIAVQAHKGSEASTRRTRDSQLMFYNKRSEVIWKFREALDPSQPGGSCIALPPSPTLMADLAAPTYETIRMAHGMGIKVEPKTEVCARLHRSTDEGDSVVMSWSAGPTHVTDGRQWAAEAQLKLPMGRRPTVLMGRSNRRR
jgi:hypothetical protein